MIAAIYARKSTEQAEEAQRFLARQR